VNEDTFTIRPCLLHPRQPSDVQAAISLLPPLLLLIPLHLSASAPPAAAPAECGECLVIHICGHLIDIRPMMVQQLHGRQMLAHEG
jgi:hypothetical protein